MALVERGGDPHKGKWALPGGFVDPDEDLAAAAVRELAEETGLTVPADRLEQLGAYGDPDRDPRMRVVTVVYRAIAASLPDPRGGSDASEAQLVGLTRALSDPEQLAFDHHVILSDALGRLSRDLEWTPVAAGFCNPPFGLDDLRAVYEAVWDVRLDPVGFRERVTGIDGFLVPVGAGAGSQSADLYQLGSAKVLDPPFRRPDDTR